VDGVTTTVRVVPKRACSCRYAATGATGGVRGQWRDGAKRGSKMCMWLSHAPGGNGR